MAGLVSLGAFADFLGEDPDASGGPILAMVQATFEARCGRSDRPFQGRQANREEERDGSGQVEIYLDYPIEVLTLLKVGLDPANLNLDVDIAAATVTVETLGNRRVVLVSGTRTLEYRIGERRVTRLDGGLFGCSGRPGEVYAKYTARPDQPDSASFAVLHAATMIYRQRGLEDATAESSGGYRADLAKAFEGDPIWQHAVQQHRVFRV